MTDDNGFSRKEMELAGANPLPAPHDLVGMLRERLRAVVINAREGRGEVLAPEDTFEMQLGLAGVIEGLTDYAAAFQKIAKEAKGYAEDELIEAVGEQDGIPIAGLRVPDPDGTTVVIGRDMANAYTFDHEALFSAVAWLVLSSASFSTVGDSDGLTDELAEAFHVVIVEAMRQLVSLGKFEPQVTKVKTFTADLARLEGGPQIASTVTSTTRKNPIYKGVKVTREQPK